MLSHAIEREHPNGQRPRFLVADWLMHLPFVHASVAQIGGVRACRENAERLLASERFVVVFPEGVKGAAKAEVDPVDRQPTSGFIGLRNVVQGFDDP